MSSSWRCVTCPDLLPSHTFCPPGAVSVLPSHTVSRLLSLASPGAAQRLRRTQLKLAKEWYETEKTSELEEQEHAMKQLLDQDAVTAGDIKRMLEKARGQRGKDPYTA